MAYLFSKFLHLLALAKLSLQLSMAVHPNTLATALTQSDLAHSWDIDQLCIAPMQYHYTL